MTIGHKGRDFAVNVLDYLFDMLDVDSGKQVVSVRVLDISERRRRMQQRFMDGWGAGRRAMQPSSPCIMAA